MNDFYGILGLIKGDWDSEMLRQTQTESDDDDWYDDDIDDGYKADMDW